MKSDGNDRGQLGVVITGGSSGLGLALAGCFLDAGDRVAICARDSLRLESALQILRGRVPHGEIHGMACDVSSSADLERFASYVRQRLGRVDRWINNAGSAGEFKRPLWELDCEDMQGVSSTNLGGTLMASSLAVRMMLQQPFFPYPAYHIFNMGFSPAGARFSRSSVPHRASKIAVARVTALLQEELRKNRIPSIGVHELSPGLVKTPLLFRDATPATVRFLDAVAEEPETVAAALVPKIRSVRIRSGRVRHAPLSVILLRSFMAMLFPGSDQKPPGH